MTAPGHTSHLDCDVLDDAILPYVDDRLPGGLGEDELVDVLRGVRGAADVHGMTVTIYDPSLDPDGVGAERIVAVLERAFV